MFGPAIPDAQRRAFGPFDRGDGYANADPFRVRRRLKQLLPGGAANELLEKWHSLVPEVALAAAEEFLAAVAAAFEMVRFDPATGDGAGEDTVLAVWNAWQAWCELQKKTGGASPTTSPPTGAGPPVGPPAGTPPTPPWLRRSPSASPSTSPASADAGPGTTPTA